MKKTTLICFLLLFALLFCSCNEVIDFGVGGAVSDTDATQGATEHPTEKTTEKPTENKNTESKGPVKVDSVAGMNAEAIVSKFFAEYAASTSFDMVITGISLTDGEPSASTSVLLISDGDIYMEMDYDGEPMKFWLIGQTAYIDMGGEKIKTTDIESKEELGSMAQMMTSSIPSEINEVYRKKLQSAQIYLVDGEYHFSVYFNVDEAAELGGTSAYTEDIYFDKNGKVKRIIDTLYDGSCVEIVLNSYGKSFKIDPPADANKFKDATSRVPVRNTSTQALPETKTQKRSFRSSG